METAKEQVQKILEVIPDSASLEYIQYHIYVRQNLSRVSRTKVPVASSPMKRR